MATRHTNAPEHSAPTVNDWIGYIGLATPWALIAAVLALAPLATGGN